MADPESSDDGKKPETRVQEYLAIRGLYRTYLIPKPEHPYSERVQLESMHGQDAADMEQIDWSQPFEQIELAPPPEEQDNTLPPPPPPPPEEQDKFPPPVVVDFAIEVQEQEGTWPNFENEENSGTDSSEEALAADRYPQPQEQPAAEQPSGIELMQMDISIVQQREIDFMQQAREYYTPTQEAPKDLHRDAALKLHSLRRTVMATFFNDCGQPLFPPAESGYSITAKIAMRMEVHMSHFRVLAYARPTITGQEHIPDPDANDDTLFEPLHESSTSGAKSISSLVSAYINYDSFQEYSLIDCQEGANIPPQAHTYLQNLPDQVKERIQQMIELGEEPWLLEISFDPAKIPIEHAVGTPPWAEAFVEQLKLGRISALVAGDDSIRDRVLILIEQFFRHKGSGSPLLQFQTAGNGRYRFLKNCITLPIIRETDKDDDMDFQARRVFHDADEYNTIAAVSVLSEMRKDILDAESFSRTTQLRCVQVPGSGDDNRVMLGWVQAPDCSTLRVNTGARCNLIFLGANENPDDIVVLPQMTERIFKGVVDHESITIGPRGFIPLLISRPYDKASRTFHNQVVYYVDISRTHSFDVPAKIRANPGNRVYVQWDIQTKVQKSVLNGISQLSISGPKSKFVDWNLRARTFLISKDLDTLEPRDILAEVRQAPIFKGNMIDTMVLDKEQKEAVVALEHAPGGFAFVQGPAGTGKSWVWEQIVKIVLRSNVPYQILIISPSNKAVDTITRKLEAVFHDLPSSTRNPYFLRVHSAGSEKVLGRMEANKTRPVPVDSRPTNFPDPVVVEQLEECRQVFLEQYRKATQVEFEGVFDRRVKMPHLSVMTTAIERAGIIKTDRTVPNRNRFARFRALYKIFAKGQEPNKDEWTAVVTDLWNDTLEQAAIIVSTTAQAGMSRVTNPLIKTARLLMVDEAAHQSESELIPFFSARFERMEGCVQLGDIYQLNPTVVSTSTENLYADQARLSLMTRMVSIGFPSVHLRTQYRFVQQLADLANKTTYDGLLISTPAAQVDHREEAQAFQAVAHRYIKKNTNMILIDVLNGAANQVQLSASMSRSNELIAIIVATIVRDLLKAHPGATILVLTAYTDQKNLYQRIVNNMASGIEGMDRVTVAVSDSVQGDQFNYVIKDFLVPSQQPSIGFQGDPNRLTMEMTRARDGMIIIANLQALQRCHKAQRGLLSRLVNEFIGFRYKFKYTDVMPFNHTTNQSDRHLQLPGWGGSSD